MNPKNNRDLNQGVLHLWSNFVTWLNMRIMAQLVISAIYYLGKSFDNEDDTKIFYILSHLKVC